MTFLSFSDLITTPPPRHVSPFVVVKGFGLPVASCHTVTCALLLKAFDGPSGLCSWTLTHHSNVVFYYFLQSLWPASLPADPSSLSSFDSEKTPG